MQDDSIAPVTVEHRENLAIVTINTPKRRNALTEEGRALMMTSLQALAVDPTVRAIVLTGAEGHFCAGADVGNMKNRPSTFIEQRQIIGIHTHPILKLLYGGPKPCVAAVEGVCFGMGVSLAAACDIVVTATNARYCVAQLRVGLAPDVGILWTLPRRIGEGKARELLLTAKEIDAATAHAIGLANVITAPGKTLEAAIEAARQLAAIPPISMTLVRAALANTCNTLDETLKSEIAIQHVLQRTRDHKEAIAAFVEKRQPVFTGE